MYVGSIHKGRLQSGLSSDRSLSQAKRQAKGSSLPLFLQPKLAVSRPGDPAEVEADRVANQVMRMPEPVVQRQCAACEEEAVTVSRKTQGAIGSDAPASVGSVIRSPGQPLAASTRAFFEPRLGQDLSHVCVHTDGEAQQSARDVNALAYTVGSHVVFDAGRYAPGTPDGQRLLGHELTHVAQQTPSPIPFGPHDKHDSNGLFARTSPIATQSQAGGIWLQRQCNPAWTGLPWAQRVANAKAAAANATSNQCLADMIDEALTPNVTVEQSTNSSGTLVAAIAAGRYTEWGTLSDLHINFDRNLNAKTGDPNQYGETRFVTPPDNSTINIYIVLGPKALDPIGPQYTQMAAHHEGEHAWDFLSQWAMIGSTPHGATAGEELAIHTEGFSRYFLDMWTIDNSTGAYSIANTFSPLFGYYAGATQAERDSAFDSIQMFFDVRITGIPCNLMKFKIWLQMVQNARPASDALIVRINALPGLGLVRGTAPSTHFNTALACS